jgi:hypothetical protein
MNKKKHHYVPKLYLRKFASEPRRINILDLETSNFYRNGSLRDQCFRPKFYGTDDELENYLMEIESIVAPTLSSISEGSRIPERSTDDHKNLLVFVALQILRTPMNAESMSESFNKAVDLIAPRDRDMAEQKEKHYMEANDAVAMFLENYLFVAMCLDDLGMLLIVNKKGPSFVTSDNPIVQYNQYCEGLKMGTTGALRRGLQLFLPLSPSLLILFYDKLVYKIREKNSSLLEISNTDDLTTLNILQSANAHKVLLFSNWDDVEAIRNVIRKGAKFRRRELGRVEEFVAENNREHHSLLQMYSPPLNVGLNLSFMRLRRNAKRVSLKQRALEYRKPIGPDLNVNRSESRNRLVQRFVRKDL